MSIDLKDYNWSEAFHFAGGIRTATDCSAEPFTANDVAEILASSEGQNDGDSWLAAGRLKDGRFFYLSAWCDYTGWDCRSGGDAQVAATLEALIRFGMDNEGRERLNMPIEDKQ